MPQLDEAINLAKSIKNETFIDSANIEKYICDINKSNKLNKLLDGKKEMPDDIKAYIHYNIYKYLADNNSKSKSKKLYTKLYNNNKKFEYKYYLDQLKWHLSLSLKSVCKKYNLILSLNV